MCGKNKPIRSSHNYNKKRSKNSSKHKYYSKRERMSIIKVNFPLLEITLVSACKSRSKQWERMEKKQQKLSIGLG
jgi:hypothetical protein